MNERFDKRFVCFRGGRITGDLMIDQPMDKSVSAIIPAFVAMMMALAGCAGTQSVSNLTNEPATAVASAPPSPARSPEQAAAVADIRRKAAAAEEYADGEPDVYQSFAPPGRERRSYAEIKAIEAELKAIADARRTAGVAELEALRRRAAHLEALRRQHESILDDDANTGSINQ
jgi:hypothetical protein